MAVRIVLADDHAMVRECLKTYLESSGFSVVGEACDGADAVRQTSTLHPQIAVFDLAMPELNGIDAAREVSRLSPQTKTILLTAYSEDRYVMEALRAGVVGYVLKSKAASDLVQAIHEVEDGHFYLSPGISRAVVQQMLNNPPGADPVLSRRERQVLKLIADGKTTKEIAKELGISTKTGETHRTNLMEKLDIHDVAGLVRYAIRQGLVQP